MTNEFPTNNFFSLYFTKNDYKIPNIDHCDSNYLFKNQILSPYDAYTFLQLDDPATCSVKYEIK